MANVTRWLLLRGLSREVAHWGLFPERLRAEIPGAEVYCIDLPGVGEFRAMTSPASIGPICDFIRTRYREAAGSGPKPYLFALSLGGMVATRWLFSHPEELSGAVLVNTSLKGYSGALRRLTPKAIAAVVRALATDDVEQRERAILRLVSKRAQQEESLADAWIAIQRERPVTRSNAVRQLLAAAAYRPPHRPPRVPTLLLRSLGDELAHPDCTRDLAAVWGSPVKTHSSAGHDLTLDDADWTAKAVASWQRSLTES